MATTTDRIPNRWGIAVAAVVMQICLGAAYGWSVFVGAAGRDDRWTLTQVSLNFTLAIAFLGVGTIIGGLWQDRVGPRPSRPSPASSTASAICSRVGFASHGIRLVGLYFSYGLLGGIGMGMGYITPVATITKWFPDRRGLMTGVAVAGYGAGALIMSPFAARVIVARGVPATFDDARRRLPGARRRRRAVLLQPARRAGGRPDGSRPARCRAAATTYRLHRRARRCARGSSGCCG